MGSRSRHPVMESRFLYLAVKMMSEALGLMPLRISAALGRFLGSCFYYIDRKDRSRALGHLKIAYKDTYRESEARAQVLGLSQNLGSMVAEFARIPSLSLNNIDTFINWDGHDKIIENLLAEGNGLILVSGHIGNWEILGAALAIKGYSTGAVARRLQNPYLDKYVTRIRQSSGQQIWDKSGAIRSMIKVLRNGKGLGVLVDQDARDQSLPVPFFGVEARTVPTPANLSLLIGSPIMVMALHRLAPMRFIVKGRSILRPSKEKEKDAERRRIMEQINLDLESIIREDPSQWVWFHRRWRKNEPGV